MSNMTKKTAYFDDCTSVVKCYLNYLVSGDISKDLADKYPNMSEDTASLYSTILNNDYRVCAEVLRHSVSVVLGLESGLNFFQWKDLSAVCSDRLRETLKFSESLSRTKKQGILQTCVHIFYVLKDIAISEV